ncbi:MAG: orange carotenoid protein N-terminal domain-containing protein [Rhizonema sp. PD37]|nr:orange carotenoid protein N-terminal domain-containing protein [Rhizonema sp. PD37]
MTLTTDSAQSRFFKIFNDSIQIGDAVTSTVAVFKTLTVDDRLAVLWYTYTEMGRSITPAATGTARLQLAEGLLIQIKQMPHSEQLQAIRDLAANNNTPISSSYGVLSANTKLAFWYELSELMVKGFVIPIPDGYKLSHDGAKILEALKLLDFGQQIIVLRKIVTDMGVDPLGD